ncbi:MAG: hypothetical protein LUO82_02285 [Methanomicrobiales archaeon]|nr:hypothetical protein [Methanomicrobiales archaeon]
MAYRRWVHDNGEGWKWQDPEAILSSIGVSEGAVFVDVECGEGFFTLTCSEDGGKGQEGYRD